MSFCLPESEVRSPASAGVSILKPATQTFRPDILKPSLFHQNASHAVAVVLVYYFYLSISTLYPSLFQLLCTLANRSPSHPQYVVFKCYSGLNVWIYYLIQIVIFDFLKLVG